VGIQIENEFEVPASVDRAWAFLLDVERVAACAPGAQLTEVVDDTTWKGKVTVKLGPVTLAFAGTVAIEERDDDAHRVVLRAKGMEQRGKGAATAVITAWAEQANGATRVKFHQDLTVSGAVAQYSRGMMQDVSARLTRDFARCVQEGIQAEPQPQPEGAAESAPVQSGAPSGTAPPPSAAPSPARPQPTATPVHGLRLTLWALWRAVVRFFRRLFGLDRR
jgi:carbon monoxide dehydrogenase subunit G